MGTWLYSIPTLSIELFNFFFWKYTSYFMQVSWPQVSWPMFHSYLWYLLTSSCYVQRGLLMWSSLVSRDRNVCFVLKAFRGPVLVTSILRSVDQHTETPLVWVSGGFKDITQDSPKTQADQNKVYSMRNESPSFSCRCFMEWNFDSFSIKQRWKGFDLCTFTTGRTNSQPLKDPFEFGTFLPGIYF